MGKVRHLPNQQSLERYYLQQGRGDMAYFSGPGHQRGHGLGGLFGKLFRAAVPIFRNTVSPVLKKAGKAVAKQALSTGVGVASDLLDGQTIGHSLNQRLPTAANEMAFKGATHLQQMLANRNPPPSKRRKHSKQSKKRVARKVRKTIKGHDIFV